jgi:8-oxo-dGTP diphosphatase
VSHWAGGPAIGEPDKCSELVWADSAAMPTDTIGYVRAALDAVAPGTPTLLPYGWD